MLKICCQRILSAQIGIVHCLLALTLAGAFPLNTRAQSTIPAPAQGGQDNSDAAAKAAARKAKFEEAKRRLEQGADASVKEVPSDPNQTLFVSPALVNMLVGETHAFCVFDIEGHLLTNSAQWTLSTPGVAYFQPAPSADPEVSSKSPGRVTLRATIGARFAEAEINVIEGDHVAPGTVLWSAAQIPGYHTDQMVQAMPSARGPDMYITDRNEKGEVLLRALLSDGRQLWMKKYSADNAPKEIVPTPRGVLTVTQSKP